MHHHHNHHRTFSQPGSTSCFRSSQLFSLSVVHEKGYLVPFPSALSTDKSAPTWWCGVAVRCFKTYLCCTRNVWAIRGFCVILLDLLHTLLRSTGVRTKEAGLWCLEAAGCREVPRAVEQESVCARGTTHVSVSGRTSVHVSPSRSSSLAAVECVPKFLVGPA